MFSLIICAVLLTATTDFVKSKCIDSPQIPDGITVHKVVETWEQADLQCKSEGAILASPTTTELLNVMKSLIGIHNTPYFIGTKTTDNFGNFTSVEGVPLDNMTAAVVKMIDKLDPRDGDCLSMDENKISVVPCCIRLPFICYKAHSEITSETIEITTEEETTRTTPSMPKMLKCGAAERYIYFESTGSCYKKHVDKKNFTDAMSTCEDEGAHLVIINDSAEAAILNNYFNSAVYPFIFVGLHDVTSYGDWRTITGEPITEVYHKWKDGHASGPRGRDCNCVVIRQFGLLDDFNCDVKRDFICEI